MNTKGFKVNFLGDSITEGAGITDQENCRYDNLVGRMLEFSQVNSYGVSGTRLAHQPYPSVKPRYDLCFCGRAYDMDQSADMVVVYGGVNDYIHGNAPFGEPGDTMPSTYCGGVYFLMNYLRETYRNKPVIFMTPARCFLRHEVDDLYPSVHATKQVAGKPLKDYVVAIEEIAKQFDVKVLNLYDGLGIDPHIPEHFENYTVDGLHFNEEGHRLLAQKLADFIKAL